MIERRRFARAATIPVTALAALLGCGLQPTVALAQSSCIQVPVDCRVTSAFGARYNPVTKNFSTEFHHGVDFGCPIGTSVVAAESGIVAVSGFSNSAGNWVVARSSGGSGATIKYMHHERNLASMGGMVSKGQEIAKTGNTGRSTGPHLHFQVEVAGKAVDPMARFCTQPQLKPGVLQGNPSPETDVVAQSTQATAPSDNGGVAPAMGLDGSVFEVVSDVIAARTLNPDYARQLASLSEPRLYAELAYMQSIRLKVQYELSQNRERMLATQAMIQLLMTEKVLRPKLDAQRKLASTK